MNKILVLTLGLSLFSFSACQSGKSGSAEEAPEIPQKLVTAEPEPHPYGGWYCPDNLRGFPAVNLDEWDQVPVVRNRLPTKEETRNGSSLIYIDPEKYPDARPMDIDLPQLARYYNRYSGRYEWIIVIQAIVINQDSVLGFRYANGGNGSARFNEVEFLSPNDDKNLPPGRFVTINESINALPAEIFKKITEYAYERRLKEEFGENTFMEAGWDVNSKVYQRLGADSVEVGHVSAYWQDVYIQVDYQIEGKPYTDKILLSKFENENRTGLSLVSGPFGKDYKRQKRGWERWVDDLKEAYNSQFFMPGGK